MMKELLENSVGQGDRATVTSAVSVGKTLREARERLGLSIADVSSQTKIVPRQIEALEADDFQHLPEMTFVRGFVRCYAKLVQLDALPLLAALPQPAAVRTQLKPASVEVPFPRAHAQQMRNLLWLAAALLLVVPAILYAVWHYTAPSTQPEAAQVETQVVLPAEMRVIPASPVPETSMMAASEVASAVPAASQVAAPAASSVVTAPPPAQPPVQSVQPPAVPAKPTLPAAKPAAQSPQIQSAAGNKQTVAGSVPPQVAPLRLVFDAESWTEIRDRDDKVISSQVNPRGSELRLEGRAPFTLVIGHAATTRLYYRGKQVDLTPYINAFSEVARVTLE